MQNQKSKGRKNKSGLSPGTLMYVGDERQHRPSISIIDFNESMVEELTEIRPADCSRIKSKDTISWLNITGVHDISLIRQIGKIFSIHSLALEDIVTTTQRPKVESYPDHLLIFMRMAYLSSEGRINYEQISLLLANSYVICFQELPGDVFDTLRSRLRSGNERLRKHGADYLAYCIMDAIVDRYFTILEHVGDKLEEYDEKALISYEDFSLEEIHILKKEVYSLRKAVLPLRELLSSLRSLESEKIRQETYVYFRDLVDHVLQVNDQIDSSREWLNSITDLYMSQLSNRINQIMKVITVLASIFIPLTFITSLYGMNFEYMPELSFRYSYFILLGVMTVISAVVIIYFKKIKWL